MDDLSRCFEPDHVSEVAEKFSIFGFSADAAARGDDAPWCGRVAKFFDERGFHIAECGFTIVFKDLRDGFSCLFFQQLIHVHKGVAEALLELSADG